MKFLVAALALSTAATVAAADETWSTATGTVIYERDIEFTGVLSFPAEVITYIPGSARANVYVEYLADNVDSRGYMYGIWILPEKGNMELPVCATTMTGPDGLSSNTWGTAALLWDNYVAPSGFTMLYGNCGGDRWGMMRADAK